MQQRPPAGAAAPPVGPQPPPPPVRPVVSAAQVIKQAAMANKQARTAPPPMAVSARQQQLQQPTPQQAHAPQKQQPQPPPQQLQRNNANGTAGVAQVRSPPPPPAHATSAAPRPSYAVPASAAAASSAPSSARPPLPPPAVASIAGVPARSAAPSPPPQPPVATDGVANSHFSAAPPASSLSAGAGGSSGEGGDELLHAWEAMMQSMDFDDEQQQQQQQMAGGLDEQLLRSKALLSRVLLLLSRSSLTDVTIPQRVVLFVRSLAESELESSDAGVVPLVEANLPSLFPFIHTFLQLLARPECGEPQRAWFAQEVLRSVEVFFDLLHSKPDEAAAARAARQDVEQLLADLLPLHRAFCSAGGGGGVRHGAAAFLSHHTSPYQLSPSASFAAADVPAWNRLRQLAACQCCQQTWTQDREHWQAAAVAPRPQGATPKLHPSAAANPVPPCSCNIASPSSGECRCECSSAMLSRPLPSRLQKHSMLSLFTLNLRLHGRPLCVRLTSPQQLHFYTEVAMRLYVWMLREQFGDIEATEEQGKRADSIRLVAMEYAQLPDALMRSGALQIITLLLTSRGMHSQPSALLFLLSLLEQRVERGAALRRLATEDPSAAVPSVLHDIEESYETEDAQLQDVLHVLCAQLPVELMESQAVTLIETATACMGVTSRLPLLHTLLAICLELMTHYPQLTLPLLPRCFPLWLEQLQRIHAEKSALLQLPQRLLSFVSTVCNEHVFPFVSLSTVWEHRFFSRESSAAVQHARVLHQQQVDEFKDMPGLERHEPPSPSQPSQGSGARGKRAGAHADAPNSGTPAKKRSRHGQAPTSGRGQSTSPHRDVKPSVDVTLLQSTLPAVASVLPHEALLHSLQPFVHQLLRQALSLSASLSSANGAGAGAGAMHPSNLPPAHALTLLLQVEQAVRGACSHLHSTAEAASLEAQLQHIVVSQVGIWVQWLNSVCEAYKASVSLPSSAAASSPHAALFPLLPSLLTCLLSILQQCAAHLPSTSLQALVAPMVSLCAWPLHIDTERKKHASSAGPSPVAPMPMSTVTAALRLLCVLPAASSEMAAEVWTVALDSDRAAVLCAAVLLLPLFVQRMNKRDKEVTGKQLLHVLARVAAASSPAQPAAPTVFHVAQGNLADAVASSVGSLVCALHGDSQDVSRPAIDDTMRRRWHSAFLPSQQQQSSGRGAVPTAAGFLSLSLVHDSAAECEMEEAAKMISASQLTRAEDLSRLSQLAPGSQEAVELSAVLSNNQINVPNVAEPLRRLLQLDLATICCSCCDLVQPFIPRANDRVSVSLREVLPFLSLLDAAQPTHVRLHMLRSCFRLLHHLPSEELSSRLPSSAAVAANKASLAPVSPPNRKRVVSSPPHSKSKNEAFSLSQMAGGSGKKTNPRVAAAAAPVMNASLSLDMSSPGGSGSQMDTDEDDALRSAGDGDAVWMHPFALRLLLLLFDPVESVRRCVVEQVQGWMEADGKTGPFLQLFNKPTSRSQPAAPSASGGTTTHSAVELVHACLSLVQTHWSRIPVWHERAQRALDSLARAAAGSIEAVELSVTTESDSQQPDPPCFTSAYLTTTYAAVGEIALFAPLGSSAQQLLLWQLVDALAHATSFLLFDAAEPAVQQASKAPWQELRALMLHHMTRLARRHGLSTSAFFFLHSSFLFKQIFNPSAPQLPQVLPALFEHLIAQDGFDVAAPQDWLPSSTSLVNPLSLSRSSVQQLNEFVREGARLLLPSMLLDEFPSFCDVQGDDADALHRLALWCGDLSLRDLLLSVLDGVLTHLLRAPSHYSREFINRRLLPWLGQVLHSQSDFKNLIGVVQSNVLFGLLWRMSDAQQHAQAMHVFAWIMEIMKDGSSSKLNATAAPAKGQLLFARDNAASSASPQLSPASAAFTLSAPEPTPTAMANFFQPYFLGAFTKLHALLTVTFPSMSRPGHTVQVPQLYKIHALHALAALMQLTKDRIKGFLPKILASLQLLTKSVFKESLLPAGFSSGPLSSSGLPPLPFHLLCLWSIFLDLLVSSGNLHEYLSTSIVSLVHVLQKLTDQHNRAQQQQQQPMSSGASAAALAASASGSQAMDVDEGKSPEGASASGNNNGGAVGQLLFTMNDFTAYRSSLPTPRLPRSSAHPELFFQFITSLPEHLLEQALAVQTVQDPPLPPPRSAAVVASLTLSSFRSHCIAQILSILGEYLLSNKVKELPSLLRTIPQLPALPSLQPIHNVMQREFDAEVALRMKGLTQDVLGMDGRSAANAASNSKHAREKDLQSKQAERHAELLSSCIFTLRLERVLTTMSHEAPQVRTYSLRSLRSLISDPTNRVAWESYCSSETGSTSVALSPKNVRLTQLLLTLLQRCSDSKSENRLLAAECLGEIGAIDPSHFTSGVTVKPQYSFQHDKHLRTVHLAHYLIQHLLVRALRSASETVAQDRALCAIQQLLKYCGIGLGLQLIAENNSTVLTSLRKNGVVQRSGFLDEQAKSLVDARDANDFLPHSLLSHSQQVVQVYEAMVLWLDFPADVRAVIAPCLNSSYIISDQFLKPVVAHAPQAGLGFKADDGKSNEEGGGGGNRKVISGRKRKETGAENAEGDGGAEKGSGHKSKAQKTTPDRKKPGASAASASAATIEVASSAVLPQPTLTPSTIVPLPSQPTFRPRSNMLQWLSGFTRYLIAYTTLAPSVCVDAPPLPYATGSGGGVSETLLFQACMGVVQSDASTALFLLPYLVDHALRYGSDALHEFIKREIMAVLNSHQSVAAPNLVSMNSDGTSPAQPIVLSASGASSSAHSHIQAVFELLDTLQGWFVKERRAVEQAKNGLSGSGSGSNLSNGTTVEARPGQIPLSFGPSTSNASAANMPSAPLPSTRSLDTYKRFLDSIPKKTLALAAFQCKAFTRALKYMELHMREEKERHRISLEKKEALMQQPGVKRGRGTHTSAAAAAASHSVVSEFSGSGAASSAPDPVISTGLGAGLLTSDLDLCQNMYASLEEPDGMRGLASLRYRASAQSEIRDLESQGKWSEALTSYEKCLQIYPAHTHLQTDMMECFRNLGQWKAGLSYSQGLLAAGVQTDQRQVAMFGVQFAWRLREWNTVQQLLTHKQFAPDPAHFEVRLAALLLALHTGDKDQYDLELRRARNCVLTPLAAASWESYERAYPYLLQLQMLQEIEQMRSAMVKAEELPGRRAAAGVDHTMSAFLAGSPPMLAAANSVFSSSSLTPTITPPIGPLRESLGQLGSTWATRLRRTTQTFRIREHVLSLRRVLYCEFQLFADAGLGWLQLAQHAREAQQLEVAQSALLHATEMHVSNTFLERAKLMRCKGGNEAQHALAYLEKELAALKSSPVALSGSHGSQGTMDGMNKNAHARALVATTNVQLGQWIQESSSKESKDVIALYMNAIHQQPKWDEAHFALGKYYDVLLAAETNRSRASRAAHGFGAGADDAGGKGGKSKTSVSGVSADVISKFLYAILKSYGAALAYGHKYLFQAMPRMLTLWFEHSEHWSGNLVSAPQKAAGSGAGGAGTQSTTGGSRSATPQTMEEKFTQCHTSMSELVNSLAPYQWLTSFPQIISRLTHSNPRVYQFIKDIIVKVFGEYPQQAMWMLAVVSRSIDPDRAKRSKELITSVRKAVSPQANAVLDKALALFDQLFKLCSLMPKPRGGRSDTVLQMSRDMPQLWAMTNLPIIVPIQAQLTVTLPPQSADFVPAGSSDACVESAAFAHEPQSRHVSRSYRAFPSSQVSIVGWVNELDVLKSKEKPKKLTMLGSDGATYSFLCKREVKGDMRKNSRMMEFASVVNRLLREHADSRSRQLALRTFSVLPMSEECGLIEWVPNTTGFRHLVKQVHDENDILTCFSTIKRMYDEHAQIIPASIDNEIRLYQRLCEMYRPVFHKYFLTQFPEPSAWFQSRLKFARSAAVWSMVGYVVGLGDRHGENILIDEASGDCVHVDFDCLFGKGLTLEKPERVPFRLTPNMVDALGLSGVEGLFAAACEGSMHVMRANQQTVMSVLHTFIYDPLVEWKAATTGTAPAFNPAHAMGSSVQSLAAQGAAHGTAFNPNAIKILDEIEMKLRGQVAKESLPLSVHGQVAALIKDATSLANLAQMYIGWMAWL